MCGVVVVCAGVVMACMACVGTVYGAMALGVRMVYVVYAMGVCMVFVCMSIH